MFRRVARFFLIFSAMFAALAPPALPSVLQQMSMEQMTAASTEIVQGSVSGSYIALSGNTIFTHYTVQVSQRWKGAANPTSDVAIPGGALNGLRQSFPGMPVLKQGQQYLLFLWQGKAGPNQPVGLNQGIFDIGAGDDGPMASRRASGEMMIGRDGKPAIDHGIRMRVADVRARVNAALSGAAGAPGTGVLRTGK